MTTGQINLFDEIIVDNFAGGGSRPGQSAGMGCGVGDHGRAGKDGGGVSFELTMGGLCLGIEESMELLEVYIPDRIDEKDDDFCEQYERALNTIRYALRRNIAKKPKIVKPPGRRWQDCACPECGDILIRPVEKGFCGNCGQRIKW